MIPNKNAVQVTGSLPTEGQRMSISAEGLPGILKMLIDMYSDKELAVIRELSCNAWDSHVMAGVTRPIEVQTPTALDPYLRIKDAGLGLSVEELYSLFGTYGASTKRNSNAVTGMLGIGSKAPLTYTNQFTLTAVKDGVRAVVSISREADGVGKLTVVDTSATDAPNGVEITVPAKRHNAFESKAHNFFRFWPSGRVLLNGKTPPGLTHDKLLRISERISIWPGHDTPVVVMGNVPYPVHNYDFGLPRGYTAALSVAIGDCEIAPSREALTDDEGTTNATFARLKKELAAGLVRAVEREVAQADTPHQALRAYLRHSGLLPGSRPGQASIQWRGKVLPIHIETPRREIKQRWGGMGHELDRRTLVIDSRRYPGYRPKARNEAKVALETALESVFITDFDRAEVTHTVHQKAIQWLGKQQLGCQPAKMVFLDWTPPILEHLDQRHVVAWATINAEKLPKNGTTCSSGRIPGSFDVLLGGKNRHNAGRLVTKSGVPGDDIDQSYPVFYYHGNAHEAANDIGLILDHFESNYTIICLPANRIAKFTRENPTIKNAETEIKARAKACADGMTEDQKRALGLQNNGYALRRIGSLRKHVAKIDDPAIKDAVKLLDVDLTVLQAAIAKFRYTYKFPVIEFDNPLDNYPLLNSTYMAESIRYLNWEYARKQGQKAA